MAFGPSEVGNDGKAQFVFSEDMADAIDISWTGTGIDPSKVTCRWIASPIPNIPFPQLALDCIYEGGFPPNVEVTSTVNPNNSGVMKGKAGDAVRGESHRGDFHLNFTAIP